MVSRLPVGPGDMVLELCTGTTVVEMQTAMSHHCRVVGVDLSLKMLNRAQHNLSSNGSASQIHLVMGRVENLAFAAVCFDAVCFTFYFVTSTTQNQYCGKSFESYSQADDWCPWNLVCHRIRLRGYFCKCAPGYCFPWPGYWYHGVGGRWADFGPQHLRSRPVLH